MLAVCFIILFFYGWDEDFSYYRRIFTHTLTKRSIGMNLFYVVFMSSKKYFWRKKKKIQKTPTKEKKGRWWFNIFQSFLLLLFCFISLLFTSISSSSQSVMPFWVQTTAQISDRSILLQLPLAHLQQLYKMDKNLMFTS